MRRRSEPHTFDENLDAEKTRVEVAFENLQPGRERDVLERKLRQFEAASHIHTWLTFPGPQPPK
ncbi:hypothetical protein [Bradyrhizobium lablabi]|uniref:hypothetical protein n=1 Tax=Bradyrhizobium lablabi TaxID=722472 RepID=UPI001BAB56DC|nr:hypothetical protein [Bradyrhizobium lablabi]MBR0693144.1 hypothetical protein [Bradyrhizobium lablabi]